MGKIQLNYLFEKGKVWTISNFLSISRIPLAVILYYLIYHRNSKEAIIIAIIGIITDIADGYFARKRNEVSELGKLLDPLGDKVIIALGSIALHLSYGLPLWVVVVIIGRDILILIGSVILTTRLNQILASEKPGKIAVSVISLLLLSYLFQFDWAQKPLLGLSLLMIVISFLYYLKKFFKTLLGSSTGES